MRDEPTTTRLQRAHAHMYGSEQTGDVVEAGQTRFGMENEARNFFGSNLPSSQRRLGEAHSRTRLVANKSSLKKTLCLPLCEEVHYSAHTHDLTRAVASCTILLSLLVACCWSSSLPAGDVPHLTSPYLTPARIQTRPRTGKALLRHSRPEHQTESTLAPTITCPSEEEACDSLRGSTGVVRDGARLNARLSCILPSRFHAAQTCWCSPIRGAIQVRHIATLSNLDRPAVRYWYCCCCLHTAASHSTPQPLESCRHVSSSAGGCRPLLLPSSPVLMMSCRRREEGSAPRLHLLMGVVAMRDARELSPLLPRLVLALPIACRAGPTFMV